MEGCHHSPPQLLSCPCCHHPNPVIAAALTPSPAHYQPSATSAADAPSPLLMPWDGLGLPTGQMWPAGIKCPGLMEILLFLGLTLAFDTVNHATFFKWL